jgi:hypothetical protein
MNQRLGPLCVLDELKVSNCALQRNEVSGYAFNDQIVVIGMRIFYDVGAFIPAEPFCCC